MINNQCLDLDKLYTFFVLRKRSNFHLSSYRDLHGRNFEYRTQFCRWFHLLN